MNDNYNGGKQVDNNRNTFTFIYIIVGVVALAVIIFLLRSLLFEKKVANARVLKDEIMLNQNLIYSDNTRGAKSWLWEFGNGDKSTNQTGAYRFKKSGDYIVQVTIDGDLKQQFPVSVKDSVLTVADTVITVSGPTQGIVNEQVRLEAQGTAKQYEWSFGETGRVDVKGPSALYTYHNPGVYFVRLVTDNGTHPIIHRITISNPESDMNQIVNPGEGERKVVDDIRAHLQAIANGRDFNRHYYYLVRRYFCGDEKVTVQLSADGASKQTDLYTYCMRLTFGGGVSIDQAQVTLKPNSHCSSMLSVTQHSTKK